MGKDGRQPSGAEGESGGFSSARFVQVSVPRPFSSGDGPLLRRPTEHGSWGPRLRPLSDAEASGRSPQPSTFPSLSLLQGSRYPFLSVSWAETTLTEAPLPALRRRCGETRWRTRSAEPSEGSEAHPHPPPPPLPLQLLRCMRRRGGAGPRGGGGGGGRLGRRGYAEEGDEGSARAAVRCSRRATSPPFASHFTFSRFLAQIYAGANPGQSRRL